MGPLWGQHHPIPLLLIIELDVNFPCIGGSNTDAPDEECPPPFAIAYPVVWAILVAELVSDIDETHAVIVVLYHVQAEVPNEPNVLVYL